MSAYLTPVQIGKMEPGSALGARRLNELEQFEGRIVEMGVDGSGIMHEVTIDGGRGQRRFEAVDSVFWLPRPGWSPTEYGFVLQLALLDRDVATFTHQPPNGPSSLAQLQLPTENWEAMGRPGSLDIRIIEGRPL